MQAPVSAGFDEPTIPPRLRWPLAALWISLGLHAAVIALVQVAPPAGGTAEAPVIELRLVSTHAAPTAIAAAPSSSVVPKPDVEPVARLVPSATPEALPGAKPVAPPTSSPDDEKPQGAPQPSPSAPAVPVAAPSAAPAPVPAAALTSAVDLTYYTARELDVLPHALRQVEPHYPDDAERQRLSGSVRLQLKLEADGHISDIKVVSATPPGVFEDSALKAFDNVRFAPAQKNGHPVRALVLITVEYDWAGHARR